MSATCSTVKMTDKNGDLNFINQTATQWRDVPQKTITYAPKSETIMLSGGLTILQDQLIQAALQKNDLAPDPVCKHADFQGWQAVA